MSILPDLIVSLTKEESRHIKLFINRTHSELNKKNEQLFDLVKKTYPDHYDENKVYKKLYPAAEDKFAFNRLKSRLILDISESLVSFHFNSSDLHFILNHYLLYKTFSDKNEWHIAHYFLARAEKKAEDIQHFELLELIYSDLIKLSREIIGIEPEKYIKKRKSNRINLNNLHEMDDVLAVVINKVRLRQNIAAKNNQLYDLLEQTISKFSTNKQFAKSKSFKINVYHALSRLLLSKKEYDVLENYLLKTYSEFLEEKLFDKNNHATKLQMLVYISNVLYINEKYKDALKFAEQLKMALAEFDHMLYENYIIYYYSALTNNYNEIDPRKAIYYLNEAKENKLIYKHSFHMAFVYYNLAGSYYDLQEYKPALKNIIKLYTHQSYQNIDDELRLKIAITELILRIQLKEMEFVETKIRQMLKDFAGVLKTVSLDKDMLSIIEQLVFKCNLKPDIALKQKMQKLIDNYNNKDSTEVISYAGWLKDNFFK